MTRHTTERLIWIAFLAIVGCALLCGLEGCAAQNPTITRGQISANVDDALVRADTRSKDIDDALTETPPNIERARIIIGQLRATIAEAVQGMKEVRDKLDWYSRDWTYKDKELATVNASWLSPRQKHEIVVLSVLLGVLGVGIGLLMATHPAIIAGVCSALGTVFGWFRRKPVGP